MGREIMRQPNGKWAMWSNNSDAFVMLDAEPDDIITYMVEYARREFEEWTIPALQRRARERIAELEARADIARREFDSNLETYHANHTGDPDNIDAILARGT
jgi:hypothetical protein